ncbi:MAG: threonylcarbamoyl-AMP synthase [Bacteroidetes bacterium]|nr:MAG: threonylcarbamoyl-AMP synthase [Bacteroidota bacterium]
MAELLRIHEENPEMRKIGKVVDILHKGGVIIYPTDTVYGIGCDLHNKKGVEKLVSLLKLKPNKLKLSFICHDLSQVSHYTRPISTHIFKILKRALPGPYTFLLEASNEVPKILKISKKTVGVRIPQNNITLALVKELGNPIISASIKDEDEIIQYTADPEMIFDRFKKKVDVVIAGSLSGVEPSTVIDLTEGDINLIRQGIGSMENLA